MRGNNIEEPRLPDYSVWNFDSEILWLGSINAYHKASSV